MQFGKYRLVKKLATGGMAEVFLAKAAGPMGFEKNLVIKRILPHLAEDPRFVEMFLAEARLAALLNHPNIVQIFDFGEFEETYYLAMEFIDGPNLRTLSRRARDSGIRLPPVYCAKIISQACDGLAFAHDFVSPETGAPLNLIHRDVSPDNILLSRQGAVKVVDFGIAKAANQEHRTQTGMIKGKLAYMPPEQLQGQPLDRRVDVYALGVVLYELLTGHKPFDATTDVSMMQAIIFEPFVPASHRRPDLPRALSQILDRALGKVREHRYPDCRAFQAELDRFIHSSEESVGVWQLSQWVLGVLGEAPMPTASTSFATGVGISRVETATRSPQTAVARSSRTSMDEGSKVSMVGPSSTLAGAESSVSEEPLPPVPQRGTGRWVIWASLLLLVVGGGVWGSLQSAAERPDAPPELPALQASLQQKSPSVQEPEPPRVQEQEPPHEPEPAPTLEPQAIADEPKPEVEPVVEKSAPPPQRAPVKPTPRKVSRKLLSPATAPAPAPTPTAPVSQMATLEFRIRPYAIVVLDGKQLGQTPLAPTEVVAGTHSVLLINKDLRKEVTRSVEVKAGQVNVFKHNLLEE
ncbi:serine/threonine protein kinase [Hyalangium minutum]|uniref:Serine/threonine protein kinase PrkC, regulator of stationary phase n=1 Tax=Hyalangium minutum TaxID=394096 RepID=A0A085W646_9BACT|nr:serine/threonine-protein kinase [Hyalangium minutum]KFE63159.1 Serine/threonine protein kinase PrkC, regulator of stationary phase [Hyalangium minutum]